MSDSAYTHSESFAALKDIKEEVPGSLTTAQWLQTLDYMIESALDPVATALPDLMDNFFAKVLVYQFNKPSVKFSRNAKQDMPARVFNALTTSAATKRSHQKEMLLNRGLLFGLIKVALQTLNNVKHLHDPTLPIAEAKRDHLLLLAEQRTGVSSSVLYSAIRQCEYWAANAHWFKSLIVQKYTRLALMNAKRAYVDTGYAMRLDDIIQIYLIYTAKAIDRCDCRQGVLTTFIQTWFYTSKSEILKECANHQYSSYEELVDAELKHISSQPESGFEAIQELAHKSKGIDPEGVVRYSLGIPEFFTSKQVKKLWLFHSPQPLRNNHVNSTR